MGSTHTKEHFNESAVVQFKPEPIKRSLTPTTPLSYRQQWSLVNCNTITVSDVTCKNVVLPPPEKESKDQLHI